MKPQGMDLNRETAMRLWKKAFGKESKAKDFAGRTMAKGAYNDRNSEFGWNVDHILPQSRGGVTADHNLVCCHIKTNDEKADKFPCFKANDKLFEILKVQNHYEIRNKEGSQSNPFVNKPDEDFFDSAAGIRKFQTLTNLQKEKRFVGIVFVTLKALSGTAILDFIQLLMESGDFQCKQSNVYDNRANYKIRICDDFLPTEDDTQAMLDKCVLLNTYLSHYFMPLGYISGYSIYYGLYEFNDSCKMYRDLQSINNPNGTGLSNISLGNTEFCNGNNNALYIDKNVWQNTIAKNDIEWPTPYTSGKQIFPRLYIEYNCVFTDLTKNLDKEVSGK